MLKSSNVIQYEHIQQLDENTLHDMKNSQEQRLLSALSDLVFHAEECATVYPGNSSIAMARIYRAEAITADYLAAFANFVTITTVLLKKANQRLAEMKQEQ